jgi:hypothetical protein
MTLTPKNLLVRIAGLCIMRIVAEWEMPMDRVPSASLLAEAGHGDVAEWEYSRRAGRRRPAWL